MVVLQQRVLYKEIEEWQACMYRYAHPTKATTSYPLALSCWTATKVSWKPRPTNLPSYQQYSSKTTRNYYYPKQEHHASRALLEAAWVPNPSWCWGSHSSPNDEDPNDNLAEDDTSTQEANWGQLRYWQLYARGYVEVGCEYIFYPLNTS